MKKNLFKKIFTLFLSGAMLTGVGCKDYDDDISGLKNRVDDLEGKIALKADASALQAVADKVSGLEAKVANCLTTAEFQAQLDAKLQGYAKSSELSKYLKSDDLAAKLGSMGYKTETDIKALIAEATKGQLTAKDVQDIFNTMITSTETMGKLQSGIQKIVEKALEDGGYMTGTDQLSEAQINQILKAVAQSVSSETTNITDAINKVLGDNFATYMVEYLATDAGKAQMGLSATEAIVAQLDAENKALVDALNKIIEAALPEPVDMSIYVKSADLKESFAKYDQNLKAVWDILGVLLVDRIQSLVYVPTTMDGVAQFGGYTAGTIALTSEQKLEMSFRITPASVDVAKLIEGRQDGSVIIEFRNEAEVTRAAEPAIKVVEVKAGAAGELIVVASSSYDYKNGVSAKVPAVSLYIEQTKTVSDKVDAEAGKDVIASSIASSYIPTDGKSNDVLANFMMVKAEGEGEEVVYTEYATKEVYPLVWNDTETSFTSQEGYTLMYKDGDAYMTLDAAKAKLHWDVLPEFLFEHTGVTWDGGADLSGLKQLTLTPAKDFTTTNKSTAIVVKNSATEANRDAANIGKSLVVTDNVFLKSGAKKQALSEATFVSEVKLEKKTLQAITVPAQAVIWNYASYKDNAGAGYVIADVKLPAGLTAKQFNNLDFTTGWTVTKAAGSKVNDGITVEAKRTTTPSDNGDAQKIELTIKGYKNGSGAIEITKDFDVNAGDSKITLNGKITFTGLDDMAYAVVTPQTVALSVVAPNIVAPVTAKFDEDMYAAFKAAHADHAKFFADQAAFTEFIGSLTSTFKKQAAKPADKVAEAVLAADNSNKKLVVNYTAATVDFAQATSYLYTVDKDDCFALADMGFKIAISGSYTINKTNGYALKQADGLEGTAPNFYMTAKGVADVAGKSFSTIGVKLQTGYIGVAPAGAVGTMKTTYTVVKDVKGYTGNYPSIADETVGELDWNACQLDQVNVKVVLTVDGVVFDTKILPVKLEKPIDFAWKNNADPLASENIALSINQTEDFNVFKMMNALKTSDSKPVITDIFGNALLTDAGINDFASTAYTLAADVKIAFTAENGAVVTDRFTDKGNGVIGVVVGNNSLATKVTATATVTYTYNYAVESDGKPSPAYTAKKFVKKVVVVFDNRK